MTPAPPPSANSRKNTYSALSSSGWVSRQPPPSIEDDASAAAARARQTLTGSAPKQLVRHKVVVVVFLGGLRQRGVTFQSSRRQAQKGWVAGVNYSLLGVPDAV